MSSAFCRGDGGPIRAAPELFVEQGFVETTVPQITARAGLTSGTFFRHFADKRELVARLMADAPASLGPVMVVAYGLETFAPTPGSRAGSIT